jgi:autophagy-related protein 13
VDDDLGEIMPFGLRSASLGDGEERLPVSLSALLGLQGASDVAVPAMSRDRRAFVPATHTAERGVAMERERSLSQDGTEDGPPSARGVPYRPRIGRGSGRGLTPPHGSNSGDRGSGSGSSDHRAGRYSFTRPGSNFEDEEPLLFAMSDFGIGHQSRRSLEDGRGGAGASAPDRGGDGGGPSRRGSRRGGGPAWA